MREMKDSGCNYLGMIPSSWSTSRLKGYFKVSRTTGRPDATVLSLYRDYGIVPKDSRSDNHNVTSLDTSKYKFVEVGDFVINKMKGWQGSMALSAHEGIVSPAYHVFKFTSSLLLPKYAHYLLRCRSYADEWHKLSTGLRVGQWDLHVEDFLNTRIPVPPLDEQRRIADYLDEKCAEIGRAVSAAEQSIEEYKTYKNFVVFQAATKGLDVDAPMKDSGAEWLGEVPARWKLHRAKRLFKLTNDRGNDDLTLLAATQKHGMWPQDRLEGVVRVKDDADLSRFRTVHKNDFVISLRSFQGGFERSDFEGVCSPAYQTFHSINPIDYQFFKYLFKSPSFIDHMNSLTLGIREGKTIKFEDFAAQVLPMPPLDEQRRIADYLDEKCAEIDRAVSAKQAIIADLKAYKQSLIYEVVTGKREV